MSQEQEPEDLEHFITKHKDLLTVIGVFAGLTALFTRLEIKEIGNILSAFSFAVVLLLSWELLTKSPKGFYTNDRLTFFKVMIIFLLVFIMIYLAVVYTAYSVIFGILFMAIYGSAMVAMYARFRAKYKRTGKVVDFIGKGAIFVGVCFIVLTVIVLIIALVYFLLGIPVPWSTTA